MSYKSYKTEQQMFWHTAANCDVDAGHLFKLFGWKNLTCQQQIQEATMVYKYVHRQYVQVWLQNILILNQSRGEKPHRT